MSFAIISLGKRGLVALVLLQFGMLCGSSSRCHGGFQCFSVTFPRVALSVVCNHLAGEERAGRFSFIAVWYALWLFFTVPWWFSVF